MVPCEVLLYKVLRAYIPCTIRNFDLAECVLPLPGAISSSQNVFCHVPGQFSVSRVSSTTSWVYFRSAECVLPCPGLISSQQGLFHHIMGQFQVGRVCSHCPKLVVQTNLPSIGKTHIFRTGMKSTFTWAMPYKSISVLVIT